MAIDPSLAVTRREAESASIPSGLRAKFWQHFNAAAAIKGSPDELTATEWFDYFRQMTAPNRALYEQQRLCRRLGKSSDLPYSQSFSPPPEACRRYEAMLTGFQDKMVSAPIQRLFYNLFLEDRPEAEQAFRATHTITPPSKSPLFQHLAPNIPRTMDRMLAEGDILRSNDPVSGMPRFVRFDYVIIMSLRSDEPIGESRFADWLKTADIALTAGLGLFDDDPRDPENVARLIPLVGTFAFLNTIHRQCAGKDTAEFDSCARSGLQSEDTRRQVPTAQVAWITRLSTLNRLAQILHSTTHVE